MQFLGSLVLALGAFQAVAAFAPQKPALTRVVTSLNSDQAGPPPFYAGSDTTQGQGQTGMSDPYTNALGGSRNRRDAPNPANERANDARRAVDAAAPVKIQGGSLKTWALRSTAIERVQIVLNTGGRPLDADIDLWHGPDNTPHKMRVYLENGDKRPFNAVLETPRGPNTVAIRNIGQMEFPIDARVLPNPQDSAVSATINEFPTTVQGGALKTFPFESQVSSVQILMKTDGRPLNAKIELLQGPNNIKQVLELYIEDGEDRPFFLVIETPGSGNVIRIINTSTVEFPMSVAVEPYTFSEYGDVDDIVLGGGGNDVTSFGWN